MLSQTILIFPSIRKIILCGNELSFDDILRYKVTRKKTDYYYGYIEYNTYKYSVLVKVNNFSNPIIKIELYDVKEIPYTIKVLLNVIIHNDASAQESIHKGINTHLSTL